MEDKGIVWTFLYKDIKSLDDLYRLNDKYDFVLDGDKKRVYAYKKEVKK